jgi:hypothetical protein
MEPDWVPSRRTPVLRFYIKALEYRFQAQTFVQLADAIRTLPKLSDELFQRQLLRVKAVLRAVGNQN